MSESKQDWFIAERTRALALMHLTRRDDLVVTETRGPDIGLDYVVSISKEDGEQSLRQFGVVLCGTKSPVTEDQLNKTLRPTMQAFQRTGQFPYPVCLLYFSMDDDQGYYTWVAEPAVMADGPRLIMHAKAHCRKLDREALDAIVASVHHWYEAFFGTIAVKAS